ncbi:MAG: MBL fold metallo-hydrolase [Micavibrio sp.]|nr:MAG: MBL fold metallo-hydrolase [Micavibrio sp.]
MFRSVLAIIMTVFIVSALSSAQAQEPILRLYTLDCGKIKVLDANIMDDTDSYTGSLNLVASCYIIQHGNEYMLWDAGFNPEAIKGVKDTDMFQPKIEKTIVESIAEIGLQVSDINKIGISHNHFDHIGQANVFKDAELLIGATDFDALFAGEVAEGLHPAFIDEWADGENVTKLNDDHDVFGDGSVTILSMPGHTQGHMALQVNLKKTGPVILSGDLYHFKDNYEQGRMPDFNWNREETLASFERMKSLLQSQKVRFVIQHDPDHLAFMPKFPAYLD